MKTKETTPGKTYSVHTTSGCTVSDQNGWSKTIDAPEGYFTAHSSEVTIEGDDEASVKELFKLAPAALVSGGGSTSGGSGAYPGWVGYVEYDDETGEAIAADYSGLEIGGKIPDSLRFDKINFKGDWKGSIGKFTNGSYMFQNCTNLTSFSADLSSLTDGSYMFQNCSALTSFSSDLSSLTEGNSMFKGCSNLTSFTSDLSSLTDGLSMFTNSPLDATSIEKILLSIPAYSDGASHNLDLGVSIEQAGDKFTEITGATLNPSRVIAVAFKGWRINAYSYK